MPKDECYIKQHRHPDCAELMFMGVKFSVILPTYNEAGNIENLVVEIRKQLGRAKYEIIVVDDCSPDGTWKIAKGMEKNGLCRLVLRKSERGLATAIMEGIEKSNGDYIIVMDTDFSHPPSVIRKFVRLSRTHDFVVASRYVEAGKTPVLNWLTSRPINILIAVILGLRKKDLTGGFFALKKEALRNMPLERIFYGYGDYFFRLAYYLSSKGIDAKEIPFEYERRAHGSSKTRIAHGLIFLAEAIKLRVGAKNDTNRPA